MKNSREDIVNYRLARAKDTFDDAKILAENNKWNSTINRLYYSAYYAVMALLIKNEINPTTHNGAKSNFTLHFIKTGVFPIEYGKTYSQLFTWRQKGDYDDLFDFNKEKVEPYFTPVKEMIDSIEKLIKNTKD